MKRFTSILCSAVLTVVIASTTFGGTIVGARTSRTGTIVGAHTGNITGARTGNIAGTSVIQNGTQQGFRALISQNIANVVRLLLESSVF
jgi:hypothetical protein